MSNPDFALVPVDPVRPLAPYIGGKRNLSRRLVQRIGAVPHTTYAEVFVGMGGVFFRRDARPKAEVINDWSEDVSTFFRVVQRHYVAFVDLIRHQITSRAQFEKLIALPPASLTDLERSARFLYLQRCAFGGKVNGRRFGVSVETSARFDVTKVVPMIDAAHERLAGVVIERLPWADFMARYDRAGTLFYLDPPYFGCERDYGEGMFARAEFEQMAQVLAGMKGRFILSLNDHPEVRRIFAGFAVEEVGVRYTIGGAAAGKAQEAREVIISN
jgi:DNA adenine methylase